MLNILAQWLLMSWPLRQLANAGAYIRRKQVDQIFSAFEAK